MEEYGGREVYINWAEGKGRENGEHEGRRVEEEEEEYKKE